MPYPATEEGRQRQREAQKGYYAKNKQYYKDKVSAYRRKIQAFVDNLKRGKPCKDCGLTFEPFAMDFDHRDPTIKNNHVSMLRSEKRILEEIAKCDLVCAVCHRYRTHGDGELSPLARPQS